MVRHVSQSGVGLAAVGDILVGREPAVCHRLMRHHQRTTVGHVEGVVRLGLAADHRPPPKVQRRQVVLREIAVNHCEFHDISHSGPGRQRPGGGADHFAEAAIGDHQPVRVVEHGQALLHIAQRGIELQRPAPHLLRVLLAFARQPQLVFGAYGRRLDADQPFLGAHLPHAQQDDAGNHQLDQCRRTNQGTRLDTPAGLHRLHRVRRRDE